MSNRKSMTATVYIVNKDRVLLHRHKKYNSLFPIGGHMENGELLEETVMREVKEECGLNIVLHNTQDDLGMTRVKQLINPQYTLLENIGQEVENIDFIFFATTNESECSPCSGESKEFYWLTEEEILNNEEIKEHIKLMALEVLRRIG